MENSYMSYISRRGQQELIEFYVGQMMAPDPPRPPPPKNVDRLISEYVDRLRYIR